MKLRRSGSAVILASALVAGLAWAPCAAADEHVKGVIQTLGSDGTVSMRTDDATDVTIVLRDYTKVRRVDGMRQLKVTSAALIPGLRVQASGYYEAANRFAAERVTYTRSDMKMAAAIREIVTHVYLSEDQYEKEDKGFLGILSGCKLLMAEFGQELVNLFIDVR